MGTTALKVKGKHKSSWQVYAAPVAPWRTSLQDLPLPYCLWRTIKPGTQHEKAMVLQEWQYYIGTCPASLLLLWLLLLPGHFSAFIVWLWRAVIYRHVGETPERREEDMSDMLTPQWKANQGIHVLQGFRKETGAVFGGWKTCSQHLQLILAPFLHQRLL